MVSLKRGWPTKGLCGRDGSGISVSLHSLQVHGGGLSINAYVSPPDRIVELRYLKYQNKLQSCWWFLSSPFPLLGFFCEVESTCLMYWFIVFVPVGFDPSAQPKWEWDWSGTDGAWLCATSCLSQLTWLAVPQSFLSDSHHWTLLSVMHLDILTTVSMLWITLPHI